MHFYLLFILNFVLLSFSSSAQVRHQNDTVYKFSRDIIRNLNQASSRDYWKAVIDFSFIGDYKNALAYAGKVRSPYGKLSEADSLFFLRFHSIDAKDYILKRAQKEQILMINEAHHFPYHRIFITSLLQGLYDQGFRYYGAETISHMDSALNKRGYPILTSGYYLAEPQFGNLLRKALDLGFKVFPYEASTTESISDPKIREIEQAKNIQKILERDPEAKILIHAGYDHIREDSIGGTWEKAMARRLYELTGINPLTVNQEILTERVTPDLENPFYHIVNVETPSVFIDNNGNLFSGPEGTHYYDIRLAHPRTTYVENRPDWLILDDRKRIYLSEKQLNVGYPCLIQVYKIHEDTLIAVPVDVFEITDENTLKPMILTAGEYQVIIKGQKKKFKKFLIHVN